MTGFFSLHAMTAGLDPKAEDINRLLDLIDIIRLRRAGVPPKQAAKAHARAHGQREFWRVHWPAYLRDTQRLIIEHLNSENTLMKWLMREPWNQPFTVPISQRYEQRDGYRVRVRP